MTPELEDALEKLFDLPNWENRGDQGDVRKGLMAVRIAFAKYQLDKAAVPTNQRAMLWAPALNALRQKVETPNNDQLRAALLELARYVAEKT